MLRRLVIVVLVQNLGVRVVPLRNTWYVYFDNQSTGVAYLEQYEPHASFSRTTKCLQEVRRDMAAACVRRMCFGIMLHLHAPQHSSVRVLAEFQ